MTDDLLAQFLIEAPELVQHASEDLLALERTPQAREPLERAFRAIHTLKGSAALFDFAAMSRVLHAAEDALSLLRDGRRALERGLLDALLSAVNETERWLEAIAATGAMPPDQEAVAERHVRALGSASGEAAPAPSGPEASEAWVEALTRRAGAGAGPRIAVRYVPREGCYFAGDDPLATARAAPGVEAMFVALAEPPALDRYDPFRCNLVIELLSSAGIEEVRAAFRFVPDQVRIAVAEPRASAGEASAPDVRAPVSGGQFMRVPAAAIDRMAALADDLVIGKNALAELAAKAAAGMDPARLLEGLNARRVELDRLVGQMHAELAALRLAPLGPALRRLPRLVRELGASLGKSVELTIDDGGVAADKSVADALFDPLLHILRNAVDHGLEAPSARAAAGKPAQGAIRLSARRAANLLVIEVADDGRGVDADAVRRTAERRGLMPADRLAALDDRSVIDLIFAPGFSTASEVTSVSGRGVGMDAVRASLAKLGGAASLSSRPGLGTTVRLTLPASAVMAKLLVVSAGGELYGVPLDAVVETAVIAGDAITPIRAGRAVVLRGEATPLLDLGELVGGPSCDWRRPRHRVIVIRRDGAPVAVRVDAALERMETVMRPLGGLMAGMTGMLGSALLGDGRVMMVLDLEELIG